MDTINDKTPFTVRVNSVTKQKADKIADKMGITLTAAINMFVEQFVRDEGMPFTPSAVDKPTFTENDLDPDFVELLSTRIDQAKHTKGLSLAEFVTEYDSRKRGRE